MRRAPPVGLISGAVAPSTEELRRYWRKVGGKALKHLGRRPLKLVRHEAGEVFFHEGRGPLPHIPKPVHQMTILKRKGGETVRVWIDSIAGLLALIDMDVVEVHPWGATVDNIERPDLLVFDLHPGDGVEWLRVSDSALSLRHLLEKEGYDSWPKGGSEGDLHIMVPIEPPLLEWEAARAYCKLLARELAAIAPDSFTLDPGADKRVGRIYIDVLRNGRGSTAIGAYSPIAQLGFPIAAPLTWEQVEAGVPLSNFTMTNPTGRQVRNRRGLRNL